MHDTHVYTFEPTGTTIADYGDGRIMVAYGRSAHTLAEVHLQATWIARALLTIRREKRQRFRLLVDLKKLYQLSLDDRARALYKAIIEQPYIQRVAVVGDAFSFTKVLTLSVLLIHTRRKFRFFFALRDAQKWLRW